jgi:hypothetical protein
VVVTDFAGVLTFATKGLGSVIGARAELERLAHAGANVERAFRSQAWATTFSAYSIHNLGRVVVKLTSDAVKLDDTVTRATMSFGHQQAMMAEHAKNIAMTMRDMEHGPIAIAEAMRHMRQNGLLGMQSMSQLKTVLDVATVSMMSTKDAAIAVAGAFKAWHGPFDTASSVMEQMIRGSKLAGMSLKDTMKTMQQAQGPALAYGMTLKDTLALLSLMAPTLGPAKVGQALTGVLKTFGDEKARKKLALLGVRLTGDILMDIATIAEKTSGNLTARHGTVGRFGMRGLAALDKAGIGSFVALQQALAEGTVVGGQPVRGREAIAALRHVITTGQGLGGGLSEMAETIRKQSPAARFERVKSEMSKAMIAFGERMLPLIEQLTPAVIALTRAFSFLFDSWIGKGVVYVGVVKAIIGVLGLFRGTLMTLTSWAGPLMARMGLAPAGNVQLTGVLSPAGHALISSGGGRGATIGLGNLGNAIAMAASNQGGPGFLSSMFTPQNAWQQGLARLRYGPRAQQVVAEQQAGLLAHLAFGAAPPAQIGTLAAAKMAAADTSRAWAARGHALGARLTSVMPQQTGLVAKTTQVIGGALGGIAGFAGSLLGALGPLGLFVGAITGITALLEHYQKLEEARLKQSAEATTMLLGSKAIGMNIRAMATQGEGYITPDEAATIFKESPAVGQRMAAVRMYASLYNRKFGMNPFQSLVAGWATRNLEDRLGLQQAVEGGYASAKDLSAFKAANAEWLDIERLWKMGKATGWKTKLPASVLHQVLGEGAKVPKSSILFAEEAGLAGTLAHAFSGGATVAKLAELAASGKGVEGLPGMTPVEARKMQYQLGYLPIETVAKDMHYFADSLIEIAKKLRNEFGLGEGIVAVPVGLGAPK